jgi:ABC-type microcin C transport system permease subunit YejB
MKLILLFSLLSLTLAQSNTTHNTSLNDNDTEQIIFLVVIIGSIVLAILLLVLYDKCCIFWNRVELFRTDTESDIDLRELGLKN